MFLYKDIYNWFFFGVIERIIQPWSLSMVRFVGKAWARFMNIAFRRRGILMAKGIESLIGLEVNGKQIKKYIREAWEIQIIYILESLYRPRRMKKLYDKLFLFEGEGCIKKALGRGKGVVLIIAHFGAYHHLMPALTLLGYRVNQIARHPIFEKKEDIGRFKGFLYRLASSAIEQYNGRYANFIHVGKAMRPVYNVLFNNEILIAAIDGRVAGKTSQMNFFGQEHEFSTGPLDIARRTKAVALPAFVIRDDSGRYSIEIGKEIEFGLNDNDKSELIDKTQKFVALLETYVRRYPSHYAMTFHLEKKRRERERIFIKKPSDD